MPAYFDLRSIFLQLTSLDSFCVVSGQDDSNNAQYLENVTKTIGDLLEGYDIRLRPNFGGDSQL